MLGPVISCTVREMLPHVSGPDLTEEHRVFYFHLRGTGSVHRWIKETQRSKTAASEFTVLWYQLKTTGSAEPPTQNLRDLARHP